MLEWAFTKFVLKHWRVFVALAAIGLLGLVVWAIHHDGYKAGLVERDKVQADYDAHLEADRKALADAARQARAIEAAQKKAMADAAAKYAKDKADALAAKNRVIDDLRSGALRLRKEWRGCQAASGAAGSSDGGQAGDGLSDLQAESAGRIIGIAAEADAQVKYLQDLIRSAPRCFKVE